MKQMSTKAEVYDSPLVEVFNLTIENSLCQVSSGHNEGTNDEEVTP